MHALQVRQQIAVLDERTLAVRTGMWTITRVVLLMEMQGGLLGEGLFAEVAFKGTFARVDAQVALELTWLGKRFAADVAFASRRTAVEDILKNY